MIEIPSGPEALTPEWLTQALCQTGSIANARVVSIQLHAIGADGEGMTGRIARVNLVYDRHEEHAPQSLIAKFHALDAQARQIANSLGMYEREFRFYQQAAGRTGLRVPHCYYADFHQSGVTVLLLEDLASTQGMGLNPSPAQVELVVQQMARFHAFWWEHAQLTDVLGPDDPDFIRNVLAMLQHADQEKWDVVVELAGDHLPSQMRTIGRRIIDRWAMIGSQLRLEHPRTLIHGDLGGDNILFDTLGDDMRFSVIDWQLSTRGRGMYDVGTLVGGLPTEQRRKTEMDLIKMYHQILVENGVQDYSLEQCLRDYYLTALDCFARMVYVIREPFPGEDPKRFQATDHKIREVELPRRCASILDLGADQVLMD